MNSLAYNTDLTAVLFTIALVVAVLSFTGIAFFIWRSRPVQKDEYQRVKIHNRLAELTHPEPVRRKMA